MNTTHQHSQHFLLHIKLSNSSVYIISLRATDQLDTYRRISLHDFKKPESDFMSNIIAIVHTNFFLSESERSLYDTKKKAFLQLRFST